VRHSSWDKTDVYKFLQEHQVGFCNIDQPVIGNSLPPTEHVTSPVAYIRFHGRRYDAWFSEDPEFPPGARYDYRYSMAEIKPWAERAKNMRAKSDVLFIVTNNHPAAKSLDVGKAIYFLITGEKPVLPPTMFTKYPDLKEIAEEDRKKIEFWLFGRKP